MTRRFIRIDIKQPFELTEELRDLLAKSGYIASLWHADDVQTFHVVLFCDIGDENTQKVAILFDEPHHCAVLDVTKLARGSIAFGVNSYRGDGFEPALRKALTSINNDKGDHS